MRAQTFTQPGTQLGTAISDLLDQDARYTSIVFVSAFVALRAVLRLREQLQVQAESGAQVRLVVGIDLGGTSREVLEELLSWPCETFVFHNTVSRATFHPKIYLFRTQTSATIFVGSNNWTDGGFYSNYEAGVRYDFDLAREADLLQEVLDPLLPFVEPSGETVRRLDENLIRVLVERGELPSEAEARARRSESSRRTGRRDDVPPSPFGAATTPMAPLLHADVRPEEPAREPIPEQRVTEPRPAYNRPAGVLVWQKRLPRTDALQVDEGTAHVGGVRLTQARFENPSGQRIDQTTYFRQLFDDYEWEPEVGRHRGADQEHTFVPMRLAIRGTDYGVLNFEISHKPSGEAGQDNYTTILRWGRTLIPIVQELDLTGSVLSLYETPDADAPFYIEIA